MKKQIINSILLITTALFASGGACYQVKETPEIRANASKYVLTTCRVEEKYDKGKCRFDVNFSFQTNYVMMKYKLEPPAKFVFDGVPLDENLKAFVPCEYRDYEYVLTDANGGEQRYKRDLRKMSFVETKVTADRKNDLIINFKDVPKSSFLELKIIFADNSGKNQELNIFKTQTADTPNEENLPEYDSESQTLKIPAERLQKLAGNPTKIYLEVSTGLYEKYPGYSEMTTAFSYKYKTEAIPFQLIKKIF